MPGMVDQELCPFVATLIGKDRSKQFTHQGYRNDREPYSIIAEWLIRKQRQLGLSGHGWVGVGVGQPYRTILTLYSRGLIFIVQSSHSSNGSHQPYKRNDREAKKKKTQISEQRFHSLKGEESRGPLYALPICPLSSSSISIDPHSLFIISLNWGRVVPTTS